MQKFGNPFIKLLGKINLFVIIPETTSTINRGMLKCNKIKKIFIHFTSFMFGKQK